MARPTPVFPEVGSMIVPPGLRAPERSASSTIASAMRSLIEPPGLARSDFTQTSLSPNRRLMRMCGVLPIVSRMLAALIACLLPWLVRKLGVGVSRSTASRLDEVDGGIEGSRPAQLREDPSPQQSDADGADPAADHRGDRSDRRSEEARFGLAQFVRGGDE